MINGFVATCRSSGAVERQGAHDPDGDLGRTDRRWRLRRAIDYEWDDERTEATEKQHRGTPGGPDRTQRW